jgi:hypothetical protein
MCCRENYEQRKQRAYNLMLRRVRVRIVAVEKQQIFSTSIMSVYVCIPTLVIRNVKRIFSASYYLVPVACLAVPYLSTLYLQRQDILKKFIEHEMCVLIFSSKLVCNISHSKKISGFMVINVCRSVCKVPVILVKL